MILPFILSALLAADVQVLADPAVTVKVTRRVGNTSKTMLITVNKQDRVTILRPMSATIGWTPPTMRADGVTPLLPGDLSGYVVRYTPTLLHPDGTCPDCREFAVLDPAATSVTIPGLDPRLSWTFAVVAVDAGGNRSEMSFFVTKGPPQ